LRGRRLGEVSALPGFCRALLVMEAIFCVAGVSCVNSVKALSGIFGNFLLCFFRSRFRFFYIVNT
jgi:hypothetical protein